MSFQIFADGSANLTGKMSAGINLLPCSYSINGENHVYTGDIDSFDGHAYYNILRNGIRVVTSLLNTGLFLKHFSPVLEQGQDVIYISMSSGISGTYNAALNAAKELSKKFKDRIIHIVDSHGCGFGNGILALEASELKKKNTETKIAAEILDKEVPHVCQYFTVGDINYLKSTGRINTVAAKIAGMLDIKPILYGDETGHIVSCANVRGRKKSIEALALKYEKKHLDAIGSQVYISHGDCPEDAEKLAGLIHNITPDASITVCQHEPFSGAHVGPGMLGLFFKGTER
ncbi:MAG: DegV family protein [Clostridia bacterium]|nr:DegV family protein [Clostridia bacterium]